MQKRTPNCKCVVCNKEMYRRPFQLEKGKVFCSSKCSNIRFKKEPILCKACGTEIPRSLHKTTCNRICSNKSRIGVKYKIGRPNDKSSKNKIIRSKLLAIRPHKCNRCPYDKVKFLHVHHIIERSKGGSDDLNNLELLCANCHTEHHNGKYHTD